MNITTSPNRRKALLTGQPLNQRSKVRVLADLILSHYMKYFNVTNPDRVVNMTFNYLNVRFLAAKLCNNSRSLFFVFRRRCLYTYQLNEKF